MEKILLKVCHDNGTATLKPCEKDNTKYLSDVDACEALNPCEKDIVKSLTYA